MKDIGLAGRIQRKARLRILWEEQHGLCWYCKQYVPSRDSSLDHVVPQSKGGSDDWGNLVMACRPCNGKKGSRRTPLKKTPARLAALVSLRPGGA